MAHREAYEAPERGTERWKIVLAKRAASLEEEGEDELDDFDTYEFLCPGYIIKYRLAP